MASHQTFTVLHRHPCPVHQQANTFEGFSMSIKMVRRLHVVTEFNVPLALRQAGTVSLLFQVFGSLARSAQPIRNIAISNVLDLATTLDDPTGAVNAGARPRLLRGSYKTDEQAH
ncbi:hypothetical protein VTI28DRAFT_1592 [Corynascus sepedonium]